MNKRKNISILTLLITLIVTINYIYFFHKKEVGFVIDKLGLTENHFHIHIDEEIRPFIYIYWTSETIESARENSLLLYHRHFQTSKTDFPEYGKNKFPITFNDQVIHDKIGLFRYPPMKHTYDIDLSKKDSLLIIKWNIQNWYDPLIIQGCDTVNMPDFMKNRQ